MLNLLNSHLSYVFGNKKEFLLQTIKLIENNEEGFKNQALEYNIGCHVEGYISHYIKSVKGRGAKIYCKETFNNMLIVSILRLNNKANKTNEEEIEFNIFNLNQLQSLNHFQNQSLFL